MDWPEFLLVTVCSFLDLHEVLVLEQVSAQLYRDLRISKVVWRRLVHNAFLEDRINSVIDSELLDILNFMDAKALRTKLERFHTNRCFEKNKDIIVPIIDPVEEFDIENDPDPSIKTVDLNRLFLHRSVYSKFHGTIFTFGGCNTEQGSLVPDAGALSSHLLYLDRISMKTRVAEVISRDEVLDIHESNSFLLDHPRARCAAGFTEISNTGHFVMFGGLGANARFLNGLWVAKIIKNDNLMRVKWTCLARQTRYYIRRRENDIVQDLPINLIAPRQGHSFDYVSDWRAIMLFGGGNPFETFDDLWLLKISHTNDKFEHSVEKINALGAAPSARGGHGSTATANSLFIFGGNTIKESSSLDLYILQRMKTQDFQWYTVKPSVPASLPGGLIGHSMVLIASKLFVFGGRDKFGRTPLQQSDNAHSGVLCLSFKNLNARDMNDVEGKWSFIDLTLLNGNDALASCVTGHSVALLDGNTWCSIGGMNHNSHANLPSDRLKIVLKL